MLTSRLQQRQLRPRCQTAASRHTADRVRALPRRQRLQLRTASLDVVETKDLLEDARSFVAQELPRAFSTGQLTRGWYADNIKFADPLLKLDSFTGYSLNIQLLRAVCDVAFELHETATMGADKVTARWTLQLVPKLAPLRPSVTITGQSIYSIDIYSGKIISHVDIWDCLQDNSPPSIGAFLEIARQLADTTLQQTPDLGSPEYTVLQRTSGFEIRRYKSYLVAETEMPRGTGVAGGGGFNELAGYIFGGNQGGVKMEMTTPVFTETGPGQAVPSMQFVIEDRFGASPEQLPTPNNAGVATKVEEGRITAAARFSGLAFDLEVAQQEERLRRALEQAGHRCKAGYRLARYNDPFTLPPFRRNEVLIDLEDFRWK